MPEHSARSVRAADTPKGDEEAPECIAGDILTGETPGVRTEEPRIGKFVFFPDAEGVPSTRSLM